MAIPSDSPNDPHSDNHPDKGGVSSGDRIWITYAELAQKLGINVASVRRRAFRSNWPRQKGNDGFARVSVPSEVIPTAPAAITPTHRARQHDTHNDEVAGLRVSLARQEGELAGLRANLLQLGLQLEEARMTNATISTAHAVAEAKLAMLEDSAARRRASWVGRLLGW